MSQNIHPGAGKVEIPASIIISGAGKTIFHVPALKDSTRLRPFSFA
jgi:hypothetical protein